VTDNLASALAAFQAELPTVHKGSTADMGTYKMKYADLADLSKVVLPLLAKHGLSFSAKPTIDESGRFVLAYVLRHVGGDSDSGSYPLQSGTPQQVGSAITYARRYALSAITGIAAEEDDDGKAAKETRVDPADREFAWDPVEQETLRVGWEAELEDAKTHAEIDVIAKRISAARRSETDRISPSTYSRLMKAGAARRGDINGKKAAEEVKPDAAAEQPALSS